MTTTAEMDAIVERLGYVRAVYDTAIPQDWADRVHALTGDWPTGHIVWLYPKAGYGSWTGMPLAIDIKGAAILARLTNDRVGTLE